MLFVLTSEHIDTCARTLNDSDVAAALIGRSILFALFDFLCFLGLGTPRPSEGAKLYGKSSTTTAN